MEGRYNDDDALTAHLQAVLKDEVLKTPLREERYRRLRSFFDEVKNATDAELRDRVFLQRLWDENPVAKVGNGTVRIAPALENAEFVEWFAHAVRRRLPDNATEAEEALTKLYDDAASKLGELCKSTPRLKLNRVLCSFFPKYYTSIADEGALKSLYKEMGQKGNVHPVRRHNYILQRVDACLEDLPDAQSLDEVRRTYVPWLLYDRLNQTNQPPEPDPGEDDLQGDAIKVATLVPQPATLRRKGLTSMKGGFAALLNYLPSLDAGLTRDEFIDLLRQANPGMVEDSLKTLATVVAREFDLCTMDGDTYKLTARGNRLLETLDPDELKDHLLTRILGIDHILKAAAPGPQPKSQLVVLLKKVNPGWTSDFMPSSLLNWLVGMEVLHQDAQRHYQLTDRGQRWREEVVWEPQFLPAPPVTAEALETTLDVAAQLPPWSVLKGRLDALVKGRLSFAPDLVSRLHAGLWSHPVRHLAALSGLSGSGKTQLALSYAIALCNDDPVNPKRVSVIPVQPGWFDPGPLLGFVNPLKDGSYHTAPFLDLLIRAADDPSEPYVAILDEMNLSHPEQYLAPVFSAMETHGWIELHQFPQEATGVPKRVQYPANLAIIGTLNMDETAHGLSDKILDRAYTLEFWDIDITASPVWEKIGLPSELRSATLEVLTGLQLALAPVRLHFGHRPVEDILRYLKFLNTSGMPNETALDDAIYAKVLPKLRGESSPRFTTALQETERVLRDSGLHRCRKRVTGLLDSLKESGTALFWR